MSDPQIMYQRLCGWFFFTIAGFIPLKTVGQTVAWTLTPSDYTSITRFGYDLYLVEKGYRSGLVHANGSVVVPVAADNIGKFYEHLSLVTVREAENRHRILGVLDDDGAYTPFTQAYYTLSGQEFFSDGLLSVQNANGKKGYVNRAGDAMCGFDKPYYRIKPFTEGYAAVSVKKDYYYLIDKQGEKKRLLLPDGEVGSIGRVYNVWKGKTLLVSDYNNFYKYDLITGECTKMGKEMKEFYNTDYLFRPVSLTGCGVSAPFTSLPKGEIGLSPTIEGGLYGFDNDGKKILPCQLASATPFEDGLSVVELNGRKGILRYYAGQNDFSVNAIQPYIEFYAGSTVSCQFDLQVPQVWSDKQMEVTLTDQKTGDRFAPEWETGRYAILLTPPRSIQKEYSVNVSAEGLLLWSGSLSYTLKKKVVDLVISSLVIDDDITDLDGRVDGSFVIFNPNEEEITTNISFKHSSMIAEVGGYPKTLSLGAGERKMISFYLVTVKRQGKWEHTITVSSSKGGSATLTTEIETY